MLHSTRDLNGIFIFENVSLYSRVILSLPHMRKNNSIFISILSLRVIVAVRSGRGIIAKIKWQTPTHTCPGLRTLRRNIIRAHAQRHMCPIFFSAQCVCRIAWCLRREAPTPPSQLQLLLLIFCKKQIFLYLPLGPGNAFFGRLPVHTFVVSLKERRTDSDDSTSLARSVGRSIGCSFFCLESKGQKWAKWPRKGATTADHSFHLPFPRSKS